MSSDLAGTRPNVVVIFTDDQGYGDLSCFGAPNIRTPNVDRIAREGIRFTNFYVGGPICTPSRASLLTGCYPRRVGLDDGVLFPGDREGLNPDERTIADVISDVGGATTCIGKWHLGDRSPFLPTDHGFDSYFGIPYSNDMRPDNLHGVDEHPPLPLMRDEEVIERGVDQRALTRRYTEEALGFLEEHHDDRDPFFLYLPHTFPHVPLYRSERFSGASDGGLYGDVIEEIDWSTGRILDALEEYGIAEETLVVYASDNGPWLDVSTYVDDVDGLQRGGDAGALRGGKRQCWEGGPRVPAVARWPDEIPADTTCTELVTAMDVLPTVSTLVDGRLPEATIDGEDVSGLLQAPEVEATPRDHYVYHDGSGAPGAVRDADGWKLHVGDAIGGEDGALYRLYEDVSERRDVSGDHPAVVERLRGALDSFEAEMAPREVGRVEGG
jgi:arylsulfatase A-like enzyme